MMMEYFLFFGFSVNEDYQHLIDHGPSDTIR